MFWNSVLAGLTVLTYWETYVAWFIYFVAIPIPVASAFFILEKNKGEVPKLLIDWLPVLYTVGVIAIMLILSPIIFGFSEDAAWAFPWKLILLMPWELIELVAILMVAYFIFAWIPIWVGWFHSLGSILIYCVLLMKILGIFESISPGIINEKVDFIPGLLFSVGLIVIGGIMSWVGKLVSALISAIIGMKVAKTAGYSGNIGYIIFISIEPVFNFIPVYMYGAWLGAQVRVGF